MNLKRIEDIYTSLNEILGSAAVLTKVKLRLYLLKIKPFMDILEESKKELVTDDVRLFEEKRMEIINSSKSQFEKNIELDEYIRNHEDQFISYNETIRNLETIYTYECGEIEELKLSLDEIPDDIVDKTESVQSIIFSLVDE